MSGSSFVLKFKLRISAAIPGLPDGFFSDQTSQLGCILECLGMETVVIDSGHL
jgi:hypothetical protein